VPVVSLRSQMVEDLSLLAGGDSPFDDFGPRVPRTAPAPPGFHAAGGLAILDDAGQVVGEVSWHWQQQWGPTADSRCLMIGIWLRPEHRGRGLGTIAQRQLVDLLFRHTRVHRVEAHTDVQNVAEQRALEAAGFQREGLVRGGQWRDGAHRDGFLYAVLRTDERPIWSG